MITDGSVKRPKHLTVRVSADPIQPVSGSWSLSCKRGRFNSDFTAASFARVSPYEERLRPNVKRAKRCQLDADAFLDAAGTVTIELFAKRR